MFGKSALPITLDPTAANDAAPVAPALPPAMAQQPMPAPPVASPAPQDVSPPQAPATSAMPTPASVNPVARGLDALLFHGAFGAAKDTQYARAFNQWHMQQLAAYGNSLPQEMQHLFWSNPDAFITTANKNAERYTLNGGQSSENPMAGGGAGAQTTAPLIGLDDKSGRGYSVGPDGTVSASAGTLGGDVSVSPAGIINSGRTGPLSTFSTPQSLAPGASGVPFTPVIGGGGGQPSSPAPATPAFAGPAQGTASAFANPSDPRGIRNNNWGNLKVPAGGPWAGQTGVDKGGFAIFNSPEDGWHAAMQNLQTKFARGQNTVDSIIADQTNGWDPGNKGYASFVARRLGVKPDQPLDPSQPGLVTSMLGAIFERENGAGPLKNATQRYQAAGAQPGGPQASSPPTAAPTAATAAAPSAGFGQPFAQGKTNVDIPPAEAIAQGLAPGRWQRDPTGKLVNVSPAPPADATRVQNMAANLDSLQSLRQNMEQFNAHYAHRAEGSSATGMEYAELDGPHGVELNPFRTAMIKNSGDMGSMESLHNGQVFLAKPLNAGARVLQAEIPFWTGSVQDIGNAPAVNQSRYNDVLKAQSTLLAKHDFYQSWLYQHGNLNGADDAFAQQQNGAPATAGTHAPAARPVALGSDPAAAAATYTKLPPGSLYIDPTGATRRKGG